MRTYAVLNTPRLRRCHVEGRAARDFLREHVPPPVPAARDGNTLQGLERMFVEEALRAARSGVLGGLIGVAVVPGNPP